MNSKIIAIIAVAALAVAGGAVGIYMMAGGDNGHNGSTDYSILDDPEKAVKSGLCISTKSEFDTEKVTVEKVNSDGSVDFSKYDEYEYSSETALTPAVLNEVFDFDITDEGDYPEGVPFMKNGNEYTINGETTVTYMGNYTTTKYENIKVVYDGVNLTDLSGKMTISSKNAEDTYDAIITYESSEGFMVATDKVKSLSKKSCKSVQTFIAENFWSFDSIRGEGPSSIISDGGKEKVDGTECEVKIVNGTSSGGTIYDNVKFYVYNDYVIKTTGTINGMDGSSTITYYYA